jgi:hypothetical protein
VSLAVDLAASSDATYISTLVVLDQVVPTELLRAFGLAALFRTDMEVFAHDSVW